MTDKRNYQELAAKNKAYLWHPFTQMKDYIDSDPLIIERAKGIKLIDTEGREYYDAVSSLWVNVHGHQTPEIDQAIKDQIDKISHSTMLGLANVPAIELAEKLVQITPHRLKKVFYSDSGSESVEIGLKIAYHYWKHKDQPQRKYFIKLTNAYHGDTIGSVSAGGMDLFHRAYKDLLFPTFAIPFPNTLRFDGSAEEAKEHALNKLDDILKEHSNEVIGVLVEPLVQGASGIHLMPEGFLKGIENRCREHGILLLTDEVATGFGRTGKMFACEHEDVQPDILMCAKGISGGYLPLAATLTSQEIFDAFLGDYSEMKTFFHGHSYTGNQLGCAAALANIELFEKNDLVKNVAEKASYLSELLKETASLKQVGEVRQLGFMVGVELMQDPNNMIDYPWELQMGHKACMRARDYGMINRNLGNVIVFMPPLVSSNDELREMVEIMNKSIVDITEND